MAVWGPHLPAQAAPARWAGHSSAFLPVFDDAECAAKVAVWLCGDPTFLRKLLLPSRCARLLFFALANVWSSRA